MVSHFSFRLLLVLLSILSVSATPTHPPTTKAATLRARIPQESDLPAYDQPLDAAQSALLDSEFARWTASEAAASGSKVAASLSPGFAQWTASQASASEASAAAKEGPTGAIWKVVTLEKDYNTPQADEIMCRAKKGGPQFHTSNCQPTLNDICDKLIGSVNSTVAADTWVWSSAGGEGCSMGYFYPSAARGVAPVPTREVCEDEQWGIWGQLRHECIPMINEWSGKWNAASMNVKELPGGGSNGQPVDPRQVSYIVANEPYN